MTEPKKFPIEKTYQEWKEELPPEVFAIMREKATERAFSGWHLTDLGAGIYRCRACNHALFSSNSKFDSKSGWPSFFSPIHRHSVGTRADLSHGMHRIEVFCPNCGGHLGHLFNDGPAPTGQRYCINSHALNFAPATQSQ